MNSKRNNIKSPDSVAPHAMFGKFSFVNYFHSKLYKTTDRVIQCHRLSQYLSMLLFVKTTGMFDRGLMLKFVFVFKQRRELFYGERGDIYHHAMSLVSDEVKTSLNGQNVTH